MSHGAVFLVDDYLVRPAARFQIQARLLSKERYRFGRESDLSPVDFALGWGPMSDQAVLDQVRIRQGRRYYYWSTKRFPIPRRDIIEHSANMHLIPAGDEVRDALLSVPKGAVVRLEGYLVSVTSGDGWQWRSSLSRTDTGAGACELVWVERVEVKAAPLAAAE